MGPQVESKPRICVLFNADEPYDPSPHLAGYHWKYLPITKKDYDAKIRDAVASGEFDVFLNFCDGSWDTPDPGVEVVHLLEELNVAFTGPNSEFYDPTREEMKQACARCGVRAPAGLTVATLEGLAQKVQGFRYPLLVKHPNSYASIGLTPKSRVDTFQQLQEQVQINLTKFGQALIEEFIDGREFSVLVVENAEEPNPLSFQPVEFLFPKGESFKHEDMKWVRYEEMKCVPVRSDMLIHQLQDISMKLFREMNGSGYARCDIRMDKHTGDLFILEINPNCGVLYDPSEPGTADFILQFDPCGKKTFLEVLFKSAIHRQKFRKSKNITTANNEIPNLGALS